MFSFSEKSQIFGGPTVRRNESQLVAPERGQQFSPLESRHEATGDHQNLTIMPNPQSPFSHHNLRSTAHAASWFKAGPIDYSSWSRRRVR